MHDIEPLSESVEETIEKINDYNKFNKEDILNALTKEYTFRWYISKDDSVFMKKLIDEIYNLQEIKDINEINNIIKNSLNNIFDDKISAIWEKRISQMIYLLNENNKEDDAKKFVNLIKDDSLFCLFKEVILQRSVFNNFVSIKESSKDSVFSTNIFRKKSSKNSEYDINKLDKIIQLLKKNWING